MTRDRIVAVVLLLVMIGAAALTARPQKDTTATRASTSYNAGGAAAWYEVAQREGLPVQRFSRPHPELADAHVGTLVQTLPGFGAPLNWEKGANAAMHAYIVAGGRVTVVGPFQPDPKDKNEFDLATDRVNGSEGALRGPWSAQVHALSNRGSVRMRVPKHARVLLADALGALVIQVRTGKGSVTESAAVEPIENRNLATGDDARFAYLLLTPDGVHGPIAFDETVHGMTAAVRPWYTALTSGELLASAIALFALLLWLVSGAFPLGPPVRLIPPREPTSAEFIDAVAGLYARARARTRAADALAGDTRHALERAPRTPESAALAERLAAAETQPISDDARLIALARLAHTARKDTRTRDPRRQHAT